MTNGASQSHWPSLGSGFGTLLLALPLWLLIGGDWGLGRRREGAPGGRDVIRIRQDTCKSGLSRRPDGQTARERNKTRGQKGGGKGEREREKREIKAGAKERGRLCEVPTYITYIIR